MVPCAYEPNTADHDRGQAGTLLREIWNEAQRAELGDSGTGHLVGGVQGEVPKKAFDDWNDVDSATAKQIAANVRSQERARTTSVPATNRAAANDA